MTKRSTKHSLIMSALALLVCVSMLIGSTFAWFTDSVTSASNKIQSGTLKVDLELLEKDSAGNYTEWTSIKDSTKAIFDYDKWEPGYTDVKVLKVVNEGTLALKWYAKFVANGGEVTDLAKVIDVYVKPSEDAALTMPATRDFVAEGYQHVGTLDQFLDTIETTTVGKLNANDDSYLAIGLKMQETAGNEYQDLGLVVDPNGNYIGFDIQILATQLTYEEDSFDDQYDVDAEFSFSSSATLPSPSAASVEIEVRDNANLQNKIGSFTFPAEAIAETDKPVNVIIEPSVYEANITINADQETKVYDVTVENIKEGNTEPIKVMLKINTGLDPATVAVYHYDQLVASTYNPYDGYVTFFTTDFSPFTLVYDAESEYEAPDTDGEPLPVASIVRKPDYVGADIDWLSGGPVSITPGLDTTLDAAYVFSCTETEEEVANSPYAHWACDFYVKLDKDLGENEIFLGGEYGGLQVGFHNGNVTLAANEELPLLGSVVVNDWTYEMIANQVGTFICGVSDVDGKLAEKDATFTVMLRITNPEDASEYYNVATVTYNFASGTDTIDC